MWNDKEMSDLLDAGLAAGGPKAAMRRVAQLLDDNARKTGRANAYNIALFHAMAGDHEAALPWLERMCEEHHRDISHIRLDMAFDPLRGNPRFQAILDRLKLPR